MHLKQPMVAIQKAEPKIITSFLMRKMEEFEPRMNANTRLPAPKPMDLIAAY